MRTYSLLFILGTMMIVQHVIADSEQSRSSIPGDVFFRMFADKTEADLRLDTIKKMESFSVRYPKTQLARDAKRYISVDPLRSDPHLWITDTLGFIRKGLNLNTPKDANWAIRRELLLMLDNPLHVETGDEYHAALSRFYRSFLDRVVEDICDTEVVQGARIWHIYNMGFVVKTSKHTIAFDIYTREANLDYGWMTFLTEKQTKDLAALVDVAFVSHWHGDHANEEFLSAMSDAGKQVYVPLDPDNYNKTRKGIIPIRTTRKGSPISVDGMRISCYPGFQGDIRCNVYVVDVDGLTISHNGDNCTHEIYKDIAANHSVDVALSNCWSGTNEYVAALNPKMYITGHENELLHDIIHRIAYLNTFGNIDRLGLTYPWKKDDPKPVILSCGESVLWDQ